MNTQEIKKIAKNSFVALDAYVKTLKNGSTFKYSRMAMKSQRTLLNIIHYRGTIGEYAVNLSIRESAAFGLNYNEPTMVIAHISPVDGSISVMPLCTPDVYNNAE